jgi:APA family basic amino acid/polyamine antiporter
MENRASLPRRLGLAGAVATLIGSTIGSGIFRSPASIADRLPGPLALITVWAAGGVLALCGALTLAEVAGALPRTGGMYVFIREGWGKLPAFLFGWTELVIIRAAALGAVATTFAEYAIRMRGHDPAAQPWDARVHYLAASAIVALAIVNVIGVRLSALVLELTVVAKYGVLVFIIALAAIVGPLLTGGGHLTPMIPPGSFTVGAFGLALVSVLWAYDGWADLSFVAGEVKDPRRNIPRALIGGTLAVILVYVAVNLAYLSVVPVEQMRGSKLIAADVAQRLAGNWGVVLIGIAVVLATFGTLNGSLLTAPRIFFAMADDGLFFRPIAAVHPRFKTPYVAIALCAALGVAFVLLRTFEQLADTFVIAIVPFYALAVASVFPLRKSAGYDPPYRVPGYPVIPALFILATLYVLANALADPGGRWATVAIFGITLVGVPVYYLSVGRPGRGAP